MKPCRNTVDHKPKQLSKQVYNKHMKFWKKKTPIIVQKSSESTVWPRRPYAIQLLVDSGDNLSELKKLLAGTERPDLLPCPACKSSDLVTTMDWGLMLEPEEPWRSYGLTSSGGYPGGCCINYPEARWVCLDCGAQFFPNGRIITKAEDAE